MTLERLDPRTLLSSVSGTVWTDADASTTYDAGESAAKAVTVYVDANANGRFDAGEPTSVTNKAGQYSFKTLAAGSHLIGLVAPAGRGITTPGRTGSSKGRFDITLVGTDDLTAVERRAFEDAAARWESIIVGDLPDVGGVDDVRIDVSVDHIDGEGDTLAQSGPSDFRRGSDLPYRGDMEFDEDDIAGLIEEGHFADTITHEMAHVLGFGTVWSDLGLISGEGTRNPRFLGDAATKAYNTLFGTHAGSVPVESHGGDGTADSHWPESTFSEELMTGYTEDAGTDEPLSAVTVGQFADVGYEVNPAAADTWNPLTHTTTLTTGLDLGARPFERQVTVLKTGSVGDVNFGLRVDTGPKVGRVTATSGTLGQAVTLNAGRISDAEDDDVVAVSFYGETNGRPGQQGGHGGDAFLGSATLRSGVWSASVSTAALAAGSQTYYAVATDALGLAGRRSTTATLTAPPTPTRPHPVTAARQSKNTSLLKWRDRSDNELGFRIEISDDASYGNILRSFNVVSGTTSALLDGLTHGTTYYVRVRAYGYGGASAYTRLSGVRV